MLSHCVLSVDYSEEWEKVLSYLPAMSRLLDIKKFTLVYVVEVARHRRGWDSEGTGARRLTALAPQLQEDLGIEVDWKVRRGLPAAETLKAARSVEADGVITYNRSHSYGRELFLGNTALNLARMSHLPLLVLPLDGTVPSAEAPVILATDCSRYAEKAFGLFGTLIETGARGIVLSVNEHEEEPEPERSGTSVDAIADRYPEADVLELTGHPVEKILASAEDESAALLILGKRGNTPIKEMPLGSTAEGVARASRWPVLLVPG